MRAAAGETLPPEVESLVPWARGQGAELCVLFGSMATGQTHPRSDIDIAVWKRQEVTTALRLDWLHQLERCAGHEISLVIVTPHLNPVLGFEIVRSGRLIYEREAGFWEREQSRLWHAFNDSLPFRRAAREDLHRWAEEVRRGA